MVSITGIIEGLKESGTLNIARMVLDIGLVTFLLYKMISIIRGTRAVAILKGATILLIVLGLSTLLGLETLQFILSQVVLYGVLGVIIIFQPEFRTALEQLGKNSFFKSQSSSLTKTDVLVDSIVKSVEYMSKRNIGALISIELKDSLSEYSSTGIFIDAVVSKELLTNIFTPNVPLHDGALILADGRLVAGSCYLPLSNNETIPKEYGTRHRAALGLSEVTDAITVVVSEETGKVSITKESTLLSNLTSLELRNHLTSALNPTTNTTDKKPFLRRVVNE